MVRWIPRPVADVYVFLLLLFLERDLVAHCPSPTLLKARPSNLPAAFIVRAPKRHWARGWPGDLGAAKHVPSCEAFRWVRELEFCATKGDCAAKTPSDDAVAVQESHGIADDYWI